MSLTQNPYSYVYVADYRHIFISIIGFEVCRSWHEYDSIQIYVMHNGLCYLVYNFIIFFKSKFCLIIHMEVLILKVKKEKHFYDSLLIHILTMCMVIIPCTRSNSQIFMNYTDILAHSQKKKEIISNARLAVTRNIRDSVNSTKNFNCRSSPTTFFSFSLFPKRFSLRKEFHRVKYFAS